MRWFQQLYTTSTVRNPSSVVCAIITCYWHGTLGFNIQQGQWWDFVLIMFRPALGPTQPPIKWVWGGSYPRGKAARAWSWSPLPSAKIKNAWSSGYCIFLFSAFSTIVLFDCVQCNICGVHSHNNTYSLVKRNVSINWICKFKMNALKVKLQLSLHICINRNKAPLISALDENGITRYLLPSEFSPLYVTCSAGRWWWAICGILLQGNSSFWDLGKIIWPQIFSRPDKTVSGISPYQVFCLTEG